MSHVIIVLYQNLELFSPLICKKITACLPVGFFFHVLHLLGAVFRKVLCFRAGIHRHDNKWLWNTCLNFDERCHLTRRAQRIYLKKLSCGSNSLFTKLQSATRSLQPLANLHSLYNMIYSNWDWAFVILSLKIFHIHSSPTIVGRLLVLGYFNLA